jgi:antitoxin component YwqK of YwqJK toxin-antitoxin module
VAEYRSNRKQGPYTSYYPNGKVKEQGEYATDKKHREWKVFDEAGGLVSSTVFRAGIEVR